jgi:transcriptional regulator with XRE-family HTH domain
MEANLTTDEQIRQLGVTLRDLRNAHGLTQQQLADKIGYPRATVAKVERGLLNASLKTLIPMFNALGASLTVTQR